MFFHLDQPLPGEIAPANGLFGALFKTFKVAATYNVYLKFAALG
jgi:hypothetical protein